jgi:toluene monooxygenase system protein A
MTKLKREEWFDVARDLDWTYSYVDEATIFPEWLSGLGKIPRDAFKKWDEPYKI